MSVLDAGIEPSRLSMFRNPAGSALSYPFVSSRGRRPM